MRLKNKILQRRLDHAWDRIRVAEGDAAVSNAANARWVSLIDQEAELTLIAYEREEALELARRLLRGIGRAIKSKRKSAVKELRAYLPEIINMAGNVNNTP